MSSDEGCAEALTLRGELVIALDNEIEVSYEKFQNKPAENISNGRQGDF